MLKVLYKIFLMPYLESDRYYKELDEECEKYCEELAAKWKAERERNGE